MIILPLHTPLLCRQVALCNQEVNAMHRKHTVEMRDIERWVVGGEGEVVNITKERYQQMTQRLACTT